MFREIIIFFQQKSSIDAMHKEDRYIVTYT